MPLCQWKLGTPLAREEGRWTGRIPASFAVSVSGSSAQGHERSRIYSDITLEEREKRPSRHSGLDSARKEGLNQGGSPSLGALQKETKLTSWG